MEARYIDNTENLLKKLKMNNIFAVCLMAYTATVTVLNVRGLLVRAATGADEREIVDFFWKIVFMWPLLLGRALQDI